MRNRTQFQRYRYPVLGLFFAFLAWPSLHNHPKIWREAVLYCVAFVACLFLSVLELAEWNAVKTNEEDPVLGPEDAAVRQSEGDV